MPDKLKKFMKTTNLKNSTNGKQSQRKTIAKKQTKQEDDCVIVEPSIEVIEVIEEHKNTDENAHENNVPNKFTIKPLKSTKEKTIESTPTTTTIGDNGATNGFNRRRSMRLLAMKAAE